jgi:hypothetical protein
VITPTSPPACDLNVSADLSKKSADLGKKNSNLKQGGKNSSPDQHFKTSSPDQHFKSSSPAPNQNLKTLPPKPSGKSSSKSKPLVVITPTSRQLGPSTSGQLKANLNSWAQQAMKRGAYSRDVPFVRLQNESFDGSVAESAKSAMIRSSVF